MPISGGNSGTGIVVFREFVNLQGSKGRSDVRMTVK